MENFGGLPLDVKKYKLVRFFYLAEPVTRTNYLILQFKNERNLEHVNAQKHQSGQKIGKNSTFRVHSLAATTLATRVFESKKNTKQSVNC